MQLKTYQQKALEQLDRWVDALGEARLQSDKAVNVLRDTGIEIPEQLQNYPASAWQNLESRGVLPGIIQKGNTEIPGYISRTATSGEPVPHVCMKVPTGGGKTLLGVASLERLKVEKGFVLWIVPTKAIYEQTIKAFRTREHPYRVMLERISGGGVKLLEKNDPFTKQDVENYLCIMMLMLPSANRQKSRDFLKIFRGSCGYASFFPEEDDRRANRELAEKHADLDMNENGDFIKQSLINTLKLIRPIVILDEAHKAYGNNDGATREFVKSVNRLNPRFVLELSATPKTGVSNILVNIAGTELKNEEMIKLPIEVHSFTNSDWKHTLTAAKEKLAVLEKEAGRLKNRENRYIRPIALLRVQRTGKEQRRPGFVHAEDAREYLIQNLSVPVEHIRVQSSEQKELAGEDLLSEMNEVRWIITKDALKEGWDCSFAYILALLDNTKAKTAVTQMVGRVMRQPQASMIDKSDRLNRCYVYCYNKEVQDVVDWVKKGLEEQGLAELGNSIIGGEERAAGRQTIKRRKPYRNLTIFLPEVLHKDRAGWRKIDYERDILGALNWQNINAGEAVNLHDGETMAEIKATVDIQGRTESSWSEINDGESLTLDYFVRRLIDTVPNPWQAARIAENFLKKHECDDSELLKNRIYLSETLRKRTGEDIDRKAKQIFYEKIQKNEIRFSLVTNKSLNYEFQRTLEVSVADDESPLSKSGRPVQRSLFENVFESEFNNLEKDFALYLEENDAIHWWHKIAARQGYSIQGWRRHRVFPDFIACKKDNGKLLILETKGVHLKGNEDSEYKKNLLEILERTYKTALDRGEMKTVGATPAKFRMLFENSWKHEVKAIIENGNQ